MDDWQCRACRTCSICGEWAEGQSLVVSQQPALYGINNSNRVGDDLWGKNQFNSTFPVALACYMRDKGIRPIYISLNTSGRHKTSDREVTIGDVFGSKMKGNRIRFLFESQFEPFRKYFYDDLPSIDLVTQSAKSVYKRPIEIKLTVLPDSSTYELKPEKWSSELVVRPVSTAHATVSLTDAILQDGSLTKQVRSLVEPVASSIDDWGSETEISGKRDQIIDCLTRVLTSSRSHQKPFLLQPIWKTDGKSPMLAQQCFDIFAWSDAALIKTFVDAARGQGSQRVSRHLRECARTLRCIFGIIAIGKVRYGQIYDGMSLGKQTDKAMSFNGSATFAWMRHKRLLRPAIRRDALRDIILNHGEHMLSPERRFDATIYFTCQELLK
ncbi:MAG: HindVP family restriction endonuclease [Dehalococcoidia bacterium]|nr:HindVP family restriction endonuclease [Dehalococcoidia bacterium]